MYPKVSVIVAILNKFKLSKDCLDSLFKTTNKITELIVIDNNSDEKGMKSWFKKLNGKKKGNCTIKVIFNKKNVGFLPAINQGVSIAHGNILVIINNDLLFPPDSFNNLLDCLLSDPNIGIAAPVTNFAASPQIITSVGKGNYKGQMSYNTYNQMRNWAEKYQRANKGKKYETYHLIGMVMAMRMPLVKELMKKDGFFFDPIFGKGNWEDNDLCRRILYKGLKLVIAGDSYVHHYGHQSWIGTPKKIEEFRNILIGNEKIFQKKWDTKKKIIAMVYVQNEDEYLDKCLSHLKEYTDGAVILDNASINPKTQKILIKHKNFIKDLWRNSKYEKNELKVREKLLQMALAQNPDWIISLDADEVFEEKIKGTIQNLANPLDVSFEGYYFPIYSLWRSDKEYRADGNWLETAVANMFRNNKTFSGKISKYDFANHTSFIPKEVDINKVYKSNIRIKRYHHIGDIETPNDNNLELRYWNEDRSKIPTISLCMIIKNETDSLRKCLETSKGLWNELIVAWSGDNPDTKKILEEFGAKIIPYVWKDDFADARNTSIKYATKDWIFYLDGDDYIDPAIAPELKKILTQNDYILYSFNIKSIDRNKVISSFNSQKRLVKNNIGVFFKGRVHEYLILPKKEYKCAITALTIWHTGYGNKNETKTKLKRNLHILIKGIKENPNDFVQFLWLGKLLKRKKKWRSAINAFESFLKKVNENSLKGLALTELATCYSNVGKYNEAIKYGYQALAYNNLIAEPYIAIGDAYEKNNLLDNAIVVFETILRLKEPNFTEIVSDPENYTIYPRIALAQLYLSKGNKDLAKKYIKEILRIQPNNEDAIKVLKSFD